MKVKMFLYTVILTGFLFSCKAWDPSMISNNQNGITNKLVPLEKEILNFKTQRPLVRTHELRTINNEIDNNISNPFGEKKGKMTVTVRYLKVKPGWAYVGTSIFTTGLLNIIGFPIARLQTKTEIEIKIANKKGELIKKYTTIGNSSKSLVAMYYGYSINNAKNKVLSESIVDAFSVVIPLIENDAAEINSALEK